MRPITTVTPARQVAPTVCGDRKELNEHPDAMTAVLTPSPGDRERKRDVPGSRTAVPFSAALFLGAGSAGS